MDKQEWLRELGQAFLEANQHMWAGEGAEVVPLLPGFTTLRWAKGDWEVIDQFAGYFRAPGFTIVYYKSMPAWTNAYGGTGQLPDYYAEADETFRFLQQALKENKDTMFPHRGPEYFRESDWQYLRESEGDIEDGAWGEVVWNTGTLKPTDHLFTQQGVGGLIIGKDDQGNPVYPWER